MKKSFLFVLFALFMQGTIMATSLTNSCRNNIEILQNNKSQLARYIGTWRAYTNINGRTIALLDVRINRNYSADLIFYTMQGTIDFKKHYANILLSKGFIFLLNGGDTLGQAPSFYIEQGKMYTSNGSPMKKISK